MQQAPDREFTDPMRIFREKETINTQRTVVVFKPNFSSSNQILRHVQ
jgi:hypothetical protein